jgi:hypothetical protein
MRAFKGDGGESEWDTALRLMDCAADGKHEEAPGKDELGRIDEAQRELDGNTKANFSRGENLFPRGRM